MARLDFININAHCAIGMKSLLYAWVTCPHSHTSLHKRHTHFWMLISFYFLYE